jgi:cytochrome oxidase Cu insertion factor (SCO1/SenC/PrrC family)
VAARALTVAGAIALVGLAVGPARAQPDPFPPMSAVRVPPEPAPPVRFQALDGRPASLGAFRGRPVLLTFFTTW